METPEVSVQTPDAQTPEKQPEQLRAEQLSTDQSRTDQPKADKLSSRFLALAKREQGIVRRQQEMKALEQQLGERESRIKKYEELEKQKPDPLKLLETHGYSYKDVTDYILNDQKPTPDLEIKSIKHEFESFKKSQEEQRQKELEDMRARQKLEYERTVEEFKEQVLNFVSSKPEEYELINLYEAGQLVFDTIEEHFHKTQKVLSSKEASDLVEKYLEDQLERTTKAKKFQARFAPKAESPKGDVKPDASMTLSNSMSSSSPSLLPAKTESERMQRALAALDRK